MRSGSKKGSLFRGMRRQRKRKRADSQARRRTENRVLPLIPSRETERADAGTAARTIVRKNSEEIPGVIPEETPGVISVEISVENLRPPAQV